MAGEKRTVWTPAVQEGSLGEGHSSYDKKDRKGTSGVTLCLHYVLKLKPGLCPQVSCPFIFFMCVDKKREGGPPLWESTPPFPLPSSVHTPLSEDGKVLPSLMGPLPPTAPNLGTLSSSAL